VDDFLYFHLRMIRDCDVSNQLYSIPLLSINHNSSRCWFELIIPHFRVFQMFQSQLKQEIHISLFILDSSRLKLIRYFGCDANIMIPSNIHTLCSSCFSYCNSLSSISCDSDSPLRRIESAEFSCSALKSITIPRDADLINDSAFSKILNIEQSVWSPPLKAETANG
jgi:hypothetical protein